MDAAIAGETRPAPGADADGGNDAASRCLAGPATAADALPKTTSYMIQVADQTAWVHDDNKPAGYFHTYDALIPNAGAEAHTVHVFLPRGYGTTCKRYPVVYMNDGNTALWPGGLANKTWGMAEDLADAYAKNTVREVIIVAIEPVDRNRKYIHAPWLDGQNCCGVSAYATFLGDGLVPFIDAAYRTKSGRPDTSIVGSSHGGLAAFYVAASRPQLFAGTIAMSWSF